jgi:hypothetical protein
MRLIVCAKLESFFKKVSRNVTEKSLVTQFSWRKATAAPDVVHAASRAILA